MGFGMMLGFFREMKLTTHVCVCVHAYVLCTYIQMEKDSLEGIDPAIIGPSKSQDVHLVTGNPEELVVKL